MKKLIAAYDGDGIRYVISEDGEPWASGFYSCEHAMPYDVVLAVCRENSPASGGFFADAGMSRTDFIQGSPGALKPGDRFPAMVVTGQRGGKGRLLTRDISFCGFYVFANFKTGVARGIDSVTVSRKIEDKTESEKLAEAAESILKTYDGSYFPEMTVRTAARENSEGMINELKEFIKRAVRIEASTCVKEFKPGDLLFRNSFPDYLLATYRDNVFGELFAGSAQIALEIGKRFEAAPSKPVIRTYTGGFTVFDADEGARKIPDYMGRRFHTKSGAEIVYDETEAMHVFDVNSAGSKKSAAEINLEACEEIARFVSVRNIAGIIMCDFIGTSGREAKTSVVEKMRELAKKDYARFEIHGFTKLEILECSRSRKLK